MAFWVWTRKDTQCNLCWPALLACLQIPRLDLVLPTLTTWSTSLRPTPGKSPRVVALPWTWRGYGRVTCPSYPLLTLNLRIGWRAKNLFFATFARTKPPDGIMEPSSVNGKLRPHCAKVPKYRISLNNVPILHTADILSDKNGSQWFYIWKNK